MLNGIPKILELRGIQASGKTTLAKTWLKQFPNMVRVNKDDLRAMLRGEGYSSRDERMVKAVEQAIAITALKEGYSVIIDDTNLSNPNLWEQLAKLLGVEHALTHLKVEIGEAIKRDSAREKPVGAAAIVATARKEQKLL